MSHPIQRHHNETWAQLVLIFGSIPKLLKCKKPRILITLFHCNVNVKIPADIRRESFPIGVLYLMGMPSLYGEVFRQARPYVYPAVMMVQPFVIKPWMRVPSNNTPHCFLLTEGTDDRLTQIPNQRTTGRRFQVLPTGDIAGTMASLFVSEKPVR